MDGAIKVAVVQGDRRRGAVAQALALIDDDARDAAEQAGSAVIVPTLDAMGRKWASTDRDALSATADALLAAGAGSLEIVAGKRGAGLDASACFDRLGYRSEMLGRAVSFHDLGVEVDGWTHLSGDEGGAVEGLRVSTRALKSRCRVSLSIPRTHGVFRLGLGLPGLGAVVHPDDRRRLFDPGLPAAGLPAGAAPILSLLESWRGWSARAWLGVRSLGGGMRLTGSERRRLDWIERATQALSTLASALAPRLSIIDGFSGMGGEGPEMGRRLRLGTVIAGADPVAVDAVAAAIMGFDPLDVAYLRSAQAMGLGVADLAAITIVGEPWSQVRRKCRRHSLDRMLRLASASASIETSVLPARGPHFRSRRRRRGARWSTKL